MTDDDLEHERERLRQKEEHLTAWEERLIDKTTLQAILLFFLRRARSGMKDGFRNEILFARQRAADGHDFGRELHDLLADTFQDRENRKQKAGHTD